MSPRGSTHAVNIRIYYSLERPREEADGDHCPWELAIRYRGEGDEREDPSEDGGRAAVACQEPQSEGWGLLDGGPQL